MSSSLETQRNITITEQDLPLRCPMPSMTAWNLHPRVFLPLDKNGTALCPYCGTLYTLSCPSSQFHKH